MKGMHVRPNFGRRVSILCLCNRRGQAEAWSRYDYGARGGATSVATIINRKGLIGIVILI